MAAAKAKRRLRPGDVVRVRSAAEILATLDGNASLDSLPFMPEMLSHVGRRFTVSKRVEKVCDTVGGDMSRGGSRRMRDTVYLNDLRCDGSAHGGCQAGCRIYWKDAWLEADDSSAVQQSSEAQEGLVELRELTRQATTVPKADDATEIYRCQATEMPRATEELRNADLRQYVRELASGNVGWRRFIRVAIRALTWKLLDLQAKGSLPLQPRPNGGGASERLGLRVGDRVQVRSKDEIARTLDARGKTRGLWFDREMLRYCGGTYRVKDRVRRIIDEGTGRMIEISSDCFILEGVVCTGDCSRARWFCPRAIYPYWREAWLRRAHEPDLGSAPVND